MNNLTTPVLVQLVTKLGLVSPSQLEDALQEVGSTSVDPNEFLNTMLRKGYLTPLQIDKLLKGQTAGFFLRGYRLLYKIASGSFGRVFRAEEPYSGRVVAIKVLRRRWSDDPVSVELFEREGRVGMSLRHPNIVEILEIGKDEATGQYFIVMEFVEGGNLRDLLAIRGRFDVTEALRLTEEMASALAYAYSRGVTHRDIKLTNILISSAGSAKLVDFGLAQLYATRSRSIRLPDEDEAMHVQRTVDYAGLEKATGVPPGDVRSDIFFLGCVLYEILTGRSPLPMSRDRHARMNPRRFENIPPLDPAEVNCPVSVSRLVSKMIALQPQYRFQTPAQLQDAIRRVRADVENRDGQLAPSALTSPTVFVVEKSERLQDQLRERLRKIGYRVLIAKDPARALDRFYQNPFDCLIVDAGTTEREGVETFKEICERARLRGLNTGGILILSEDQKHVAPHIPTDEHTTVLTRPLKMRHLIENLQRLAPLPTNST